MKKHLKLIGLIVFASLFSTAILNGDTAEPKYRADAGHIFWFVQLSDVHYSKAQYFADQDDHAYDEGLKTVNPAFTVVTGDLTDCKVGIYPTQGAHHEQEFVLYRNELTKRGITYGKYFDLAGNHDSYWDPGLTLHKKYSIIGEASGKSQIFWRLGFSYGSYLFLGMNTADNAGPTFMQDTDQRGDIDQFEIDEAVAEMDKYSDAAVVFGFGHHDTEATDNFAPLQTAFNSRGVKYWAHGHEHDLGVRVTGNAVRYRMSSTGQMEDVNFTVFALDNDIVSRTTVNIDDPWPLIVVSAPAESKWINKAVDGTETTAVNPHAPVVPKACKTAPLRALVFSTGSVASVEFKIDSGASANMTKSASNNALWKGTFDATALTVGEHTMNVTSGGKTRTLFFQVADKACDVGDPGADSALEDGTLAIGGEELPDNSTTDNIAQNDSSEQNDSDTTVQSDNSTADTQNTTDQTAKPDTATASDNASVSDKSEVPDNDTAEVIESGSSGCSISLL